MWDLTWCLHKCEEVGQCNCEGTLDNFQKIIQPGEIHRDWEKANITLIFMNVKMEGSENYRLVIITPEKLVKQLILKTIFKLKRDKVVGSNHTESIKGE